MIHLRACIEAGALASAAAVLAFFVVHHLWIKPIWFVAPAGVPVALAGGVAMGWSYFHLQGALGPHGAPGLFALIVAILAPAALLSLTHGPLFDVENATIPPGEGARVAVRFALELLLTAVIMGGLAGWWLGGTSVAVGATAVAGFAFAMGPGHNIPMFGTHPVALKGFALVLLVSVVTAISFPPALRTLGRLQAG